VLPPGSCACSTSCSRMAPPPLAARSRHLQPLGAASSKPRPHAAQLFGAAANCAASLCASYTPVSASVHVCFHTRLHVCFHVQLHAEPRGLGAARARPRAARRRLAWVTAFCIGPFGGNERTWKPFNPILGETFELDCGSGVRFLAEQARRPGRGPEP
jgi:hypothetical protein